MYAKSGATDEELRQTYDTLWEALRPTILSFVIDELPKELSPQERLRQLITGISEQTFFDFKNIILLNDFIPNVKDSLGRKAAEGGFIPPPIDPPGPGRDSKGGDYKG
jgi:hypothetical protein